MAGADGAIASLTSGRVSARGRAIAFMFIREAGAVDGGPHDEVIARYKAVPRTAACLRRPAARPRRTP